MKKIIFIIIFLFFSLIIAKYKLSSVFIEKINLNLLDDEIAIVFLSSNDYKSILIKDNITNSLILFDMNDVNKLEKSLNKFIENKLDYAFTDELLYYNLKLSYNIKKSLDEIININNFSISKDENILKISNHEYNLCIYDVGINSDLNNCDFVYFLNMNYQIDIDENLKAIFYEEDISNKFKESTYIKWIDNYEISNDNYNILKLSDDSYDIITIPIENDIQNF